MKISSLHRETNESATSRAHTTAIQDPNVLACSTGLWFCDLTIRDKQGRYQSVGEDIINVASRIRLHKFEAVYRFDLMSHGLRCVQLFLQLGFDPIYPGFSGVVRRVTFGRRRASTTFARGKKGWRSTRVQVRDIPHDFGVISTPEQPEASYASYGFESK